MQVLGKVTYNGHTMKEFVPQRTSSYISQHDLHIGDVTVRETLDFSARCQGVGHRYGNFFCTYLSLLYLLLQLFIHLIKTHLFFYKKKKISADVLTELARREKHQSIKPDPDIDFFMKVEK